MGLKGGISIDADSGPLKYVLWCNGGICHQPDTFIQIGSGHTVLWPLAKRVQNWIVDRCTAHDFTVFIECWVWVLLMQEKYWLTKVSLNFSPKTGRTIIFKLQLRVIKHRLMFCKSFSSLSKKNPRDCKILQQKKVIIIAKADLICRFSPSLGPFEAILLFLIWKKGKPFLSYLKQLSWLSHEPLLLDSLVQIELWKSLIFIFLENFFNMDKSVGL